MKTDNIIQIKSYDFALRIIKLNKYLISEQKEFSISRQLIRSGTSIGANVEEAIGGTTKKDFKYKLS
ncbi:MAG: four helix bundle protein, partial [Balneola sp.]